MRERSDELDAVCMCATEFSFYHRSHYTLKCFGFPVPPMLAQGRVNLEIALALYRASRRRIER